MDALAEVWPNKAGQGEDGVLDAHERALVRRRHAARGERRERGGHGKLKKREQKRQRDEHGLGERRREQRERLVKERRLNRKSLAYAALVYRL